MGICASVHVSVGGGGGDKNSVLPRLGYYIASAFSQLINSQARVSGIFLSTSQLAYTQ